MILQEIVYYKGKLVDKIEELVKMDNNLDFLLHLEKTQLEKLVACIRDRVDQVGEIQGTEIRVDLLISVCNH